MHNHLFHREIVFLFLFAIIILIYYFIYFYSRLIQFSIIHVQIFWYIDTYLWAKDEKQYIIWWIRVSYVGQYSSGQFMYIQCYFTVMCLFYFIFDICCYRFSYIYMFIRAFFLLILQFYCFYTSSNTFFFYLCQIR